MGNDFLDVFGFYFAEYIGMEEKSEYLTEYILRVDSEFV
jgi:hypothetical protein